MQEQMQELFSFLPEENIKKGAPLAPLTTFRIGGPAAYLLEPENEAQLSRIMKYLREKALPFFVLGNGSNTLVSDAGFDGIVVHLGSKMNAIRVEGRKLIAQSGAQMPQIANAAAAHGLSGLEFAAGIPGSVGGGVVMNAGAYDGEMKLVVSGVRVVKENGEIADLSGEEMDFSYRHSILQGKGWIVSEVTFLLQEGQESEIRAKMQDFGQRRRQKQPLEFPSAGSTFKRPEGYFAGKLIEDAGLRGFQVGGARVSDKHCGFVINAGGATAADVQSLIRQVQEKVMQEFGVALEPEIIYLQ